LKERFTHRKLGYFLGVGDGDGLKEDDLVNEATRDVFTLL